MSPLNISIETTRFEVYVESVSSSEDGCDSESAVDVDRTKFPILNRSKFVSRTPSLASASTTSTSDSDNESFENESNQYKVVDISQSPKLGTVSRKSLTSGKTPLDITKVNDSHENFADVGVEKLSSRLKVGTAESHSAAENVHFVRDFIKGKIRLDLYKQLIVSLYHVYIVMEKELDKHATCIDGTEKQKDRISSILGSIHRPSQLSRVQSLREDLAFFFGPNWEKDGSVKEMNQATADYVERIKYIAKTNPLLLLGHSYTRYLGDLSGGRILQRVARKALSLPKSGEGTKFYEFDNMPEGAKAFKKWYRGALDEMSLTELETRQVVGEANVTFVLNMRIFEELDVQSGDIAQAVVRPLKDALDYYDRSVAGIQTQRKNKSNQCPFGFVGKSSPHAPKSKTIKKESVGQRCPWPFILLHDPVTGLMDFQTWVVILFMCSIYSAFYLVQ
mmetsp:Transcript_61531/g.71904  ORF Transcript_61531/g.71904 Transcript_61531/m.71904 type:complete len:449 (-) Transcript_61531:55-1401(-)